MSRKRQKSRSGQLGLARVLVYQIAGRTVHVGDCLEVIGPSLEAVRVTVVKAGSILSPLLVLREDGRLARLDFGAWARWCR